MVIRCSARTFTMLLVSLVVSVFLVGFSRGDDSTVDYFVKFISKAQMYAHKFRQPKDAREYKTANARSYFGEYDYVVIGAGSAGSVVANRLSERSDWEILVLEAGTFENDFTDIPAMMTASQFSHYNWGYHTVPQKNACLGMVNNSCAYPRGKGVGGSSIINSLMYVRPNRHDFDRWAAEGNDGWSYEEVLPYFTLSENCKIPHADAGYHGIGGLLNVEYRRPLSPQLYAFLEANMEQGRHIVDYNGKNQLGVSPTQFNTIEGIRESNGQAFIRTAIKRKNLRVMTKSYVTKIFIDKNRTAVGVEFSYKNERYVVKARGEIVLCAGAINSPQILQLSGIGPREFLDKHNIPVIQELDVGKHLHDHPQFYGIHFETHNYVEVRRNLSTNIKDYLQGQGPLTIASNSQGVGFFQTYLARYPKVPDLEIVFVPAPSINSFSAKSLNLRNDTARALWGSSDPYRTFTMNIIALKAESEGTVQIKSSDPFEYPEIDPQLLTDPNNRDIETLYAGVRLALDIINTPPFKKLNSKYAPEPLPACKNFEILSKEYWYCAIRQLTSTGYHPSGTCKMGPDPKKGAVVDANLRVYGINNLRVADASVFPFNLAGHTNAPATMVGEVVADLIKEETDYDYDY